LLLLLIPIALALAVLALSMCRLAARSDDSHSAAVADWVAAGASIEERSFLAAARAERRTFDHGGETRRATG
jgi:hypothetical protein